MSNYGSLEGQEEGKSFDGRYLNETQLSPEERRRKCVLVAVPLITAILIIGGFALFLLRNFDMLYPGRNGNGDAPPRRFDPSIPGGHSGTHSMSEKHLETSPPANGGKKDDMASSCFAHEKCTGLVGECCPTLDGVFLGCCN